MRAYTIALIPYIRLHFKSLISKLERDGENKYCLLISIGVFTGLRIGDILQLRFNQFETGETFIIIEKKTKKTRKIKINQDETNATSGA